MTQQHITRTLDHHYVFDGVTYPGVTSIVKILDKSGPLMNWAARTTAEAAIAMVGTLPHLLDEVGAEGVVKALTARAPRDRDKAAAKGTDIHAMADLIAQGKPLPPMTPEVMARVDLYETWWRTSGWEARSTEGMVVHAGVGYGGTLDIIARDKHGKTVLADIKTGKSVEYQGRVYPEIIMQLAAYGMAEWIETDTGFYGMPPIDRYAVLHVTDDGVREIPVDVGDAEREAFSHCLWLTRWLDGLKGKRW